MTNFKLNKVTQILGEQVGKKVKTAYDIAQN